MLYRIGLSLACAGVGWHCDGDASLIKGFWVDVDLLKITFIILEQSLVRVPAR